VWKEDSTRFRALSNAALVWQWSHLKADPAGESGYGGGMPPSDGHTNATPEQLAGYVSGTSTPSDSDLCDWSKGPAITMIDWPILLLNDAFIIAGVGLVVWIMLRKWKRDSN
jgi:hypothetical protein